jgi:hypothetical protein
MKYKILTDESSYENLADDVNNAIKEGWVPLGGVSVSESQTEDYYYITYAQAMIKE